MFAAEASEAAADPPTSRRDALVPPPLESDEVTSENETLRGRHGTLPTLPKEVTAALAQVIAKPHGPPSSVAREAAHEPVNELRGVPTPLVMISPSQPASDHPLPESCKTRIGPIEQRVRVRTPIPIPMEPAKPRRRASPLQLVLLMMLPPFIAALGLSQLKAARVRAGAEAATVTAPLPVTDVTAPVVTPVVPETPARVTAPPATTPPAPIASAEVGTPKNDKTDRDKSDRTDNRRTRPLHRPRPARPVAIPITRN
jgi:hypothetical protein